MAGEEPSSTLPDPRDLRPLLYDYLTRGDGALAPLREALCATFCAYAAAGVPVERALALVNAEVDAARTHVAMLDDTMTALRRAVMQCCLDCYYPHEPQRGSERIPA